MLVEKAKIGLNIGDFLSTDLWARLTSYRDLLKSKFDNDRKRQKFGLTDFLESAAGVLWQNGDSALIVLYGCNERGISTVADSWLSPVTIDLAQELYASESLVAIDTCDEDSTVETILSRIIVQLLEKNPKVVRKGEDWYKITSLLRLTQTDNDDSLRDALSTILDLQTDTVYIVFDRPELSKQGDPKQLLETMMHIANEVKSRIKILVTIRDEFWKFEQNFPRHGAFKEGKRFSDRFTIQAVRLDQRRL